MKNEKTITLMWSICLMIMSVCGLTVSVSRIVGASLPDILLRIIGVVSLVTLAAFGYFSVLKFKKK